MKSFAKDGWPKKNDGLYFLFFPAGITQDLPEYEYDGHWVISLFIDGKAFEFDYGMFFKHYESDELLKHYSSLPTHWMKIEYPKHPEVE